MSKWLQIMIRSIINSTSKLSNSHTSFLLSNFIVLDFIDKIRADNADNFLKFSGEHLKTNHFSKYWHCFIFSSPEPKARVSYCHSAPSVVRPSVRPSSVVRRPSVRKLFTFSTSSPEPLDGFWWNLVGMKYSWSLTSVVVFQPDPPRGGSRAGPK